jgi:lipopolysaccharide/colanic/teichoic acid biosynthesis glycosyltransferase
MKLMDVSPNSAAFAEKKGCTILPPLHILPSFLTTPGTRGRRSLPSVLYRGIKRVLDVVLSSLFLLLFWPLLLLIALLIRRDSHGPVFHRREVLARQQLPVKGNRLLTFMAYKFRTMVPDADAILQNDRELRQEYEKEFKLRRDPRVTRLGATLRSFSLDEFPQLFNVLCGEMTLVGPRMISPPELAQYGSQGVRLLSVKPGLTGLWQISGRQCVSYEERVLLDMWYIEHRSLLLDVIILWRTVGSVFARSGAF